MKVGIVLGTRPEIIKNYPVAKGLSEAGIDFFVLHTNQQSPYSMKAAIFAEMGYQPDRCLQGGYTIGKAIDWAMTMIKELGLDLVLVNGDTAASVVGTVAALYSDVRLAHVEAGLRAYDKRMCEERNRIICDSNANLLFTNTEAQKEYLERNRELRGRIFNTGNTSVDVIQDHNNRLTRNHDGRYGYVTLHRKEFTDRKEIMVSVFRTLSWLSTQMLKHFVFPLHPRTRDAMNRYGIALDMLHGIEVIDPLPPIASLSYQKHADIILTDSGCVQEEAYLLEVPCVTIRENTERMETVIAGANVIAGFEHQSIVSAVVQQLEQPQGEYPAIYGEYGVGRRIAEVVAGF